MVRQGAAQVISSSAHAALTHHPFPPPSSIHPRSHSSDSLATFNLFDPAVPSDAVRLVLWEHSPNDALNLRQPAVFERWVRTYLHWYPNADLGFIFVPGNVRTYVHTCV